MARNLHGENAKLKEAPNPTHSPVQANRQSNLATFRLICEERLGVVVPILHLLLPPEMIALAANGGNVEERVLVAEIPVKMKRQPSTFRGT